MLQVQVIQDPDGTGFLLHDAQRPPVRFVAQGDVPAHPQSLALGGGDLVADALSRYLPLELSEGQQHVQRQAAHAGGRVEGLRDGHEGRLGGIQPFDQFCEVSKGSRQPVDLVHDDLVDQTLVDIRQQPPQGRALESSAGDAAIIIGLRQHDPAFVLLAGNVGCASLPLGMQGVELLLKPLFRRLAGVDGAADPVHRRFSPKNLGPDHAVPVILLAMAVSDL